VISALPRGFYSATYRVELGNLRTPHVLKVVPHAVYDFFNKDFAEECRVHREVAEETEHVVRISDFWPDVSVTFGDVTVACHVAVLDYVDGPSLAEFTADPEALEARAIAQIATDLLSLLRELERKERYHNDLHDDNIIVKRLPDRLQRANAIHDLLKVVAIDLGSITDRSKTGDAGRLGDLHTVATHLLHLADRLLERPEDTAELDYRLAVKLSDIAHSLLPESAMQRTPDFTHCIDQIREAYYHERSPWDVPQRLRRLDEAYNAMTLHPWFVPQLLVDPDGQWVSRIAQPGPQVVTGMRGCGKSMLIRALEFHARVNAYKKDGDDTPEAIVRRLRDDGYLGLYVSCTKLLEGVPLDATGGTNHPYARLFAVYARQAIEALRHLRQEVPASVAPDYYRTIGDVVAERLRGCDALRTCASEVELERSLIRVSASLERGEATHDMPSHPASAFPHLAEAVRRASSALNNLQILFLLDDVSTRHLNEQSIADMFSRLIFSDPTCSFKMTTEGQTLEIALRSPGLIEQARDRRDYDVFDLGAAVNERLGDQNGNEGKRFISEILQQRIALTGDPLKQFPPEQRLGDVSLEDIARAIVSSPETSAERKRVYHGISAMTALCVGDIGDVITLYEMMVRKAGTNPGISAAIQTECYQQYCSRRLYHINRREGRLKDFALGFAQAAHELLMRSAGKGEDRGLRQYASVYVRLTTGDLQRQFDQLRTLIDAGVFVLMSGADAPRQKTRDADPVHQFILTFRKLFGLSTFIGLSDRDRFELSGDTLAEWLEHPDRSRAILMRNLTGPHERGAEKPPAQPKPAAQGRDRGVQAALPLDTAHDAPAVPAENGTLRKAGADEAEAELRFTESRGATSRSLDLAQLAGIAVDRLVVGLGFEERTLASVDRLLGVIQPRSSLLVRYELPGKAAEIEALVRARVENVEVVDYADVDATTFAFDDGDVLVDVTGLVKPALFRAVREALKSTGRVLVAHTGAEQHYPSDHDVQRIFDRDVHDQYRLLELFDAIWSGESSPYTFDKLIGGDVDVTSRRLLIASASPKHQRLLSLVQDRDYDIVEVMVQPSTTARGRLAQLAAEVALEGSRGGDKSEVDSNDLAGALAFIGRRFHHWYVDRKFAFDLGLTGSKMHAVACAAASVTFKISQCIYVRPAGFDPDRFTHGVGTTDLYEVTTRTPDEPSTQREA